METNSSSPRVRIKFTPEERWELYSVLDLRNKLATGQAYITPGRTSAHQPAGNFPPGTRGQMVEIRLTINDHLICLAHRHIRGLQEITGPDPKFFRIDDLEITQ